MVSRGEWKKEKREKIWVGLQQALLQDVFVRRLLQMIDRKQRGLCHILRSKEIVKCTTCQYALFQKRVTNLEEKICNFL